MSGGRPGTDRWWTRRRAGSTRGRWRRWQARWARPSCWTASRSACAPSSACAPFLRCRSVRVAWQQWGRPALAPRTCSQQLARRARLVGPARRRRRATCAPQRRAGARSSWRTRAIGSPGGHTCAVRWPRASNTRPRTTERVPAGALWAARRSPPSWKPRRRAPMADAAFSKGAAACVRARADVRLTCPHGSRSACKRASASL